ncbi:MAG: CotH kinase family protein [Lachnospiraceae bacterium]|nr:CotH kinase family protein [Lachnospiraceae bacterium]
MKKRFLKKSILLWLAAGILATIAFYCRGRDAHPLINEVCGNNFSAVQDRYGEYRDYIEFYNPTSRDFCMEGYYLSDDGNDLKKFSLSSVTVPAHGYTLVFADADFPAESDRAPFGISKRGETIYLSDEDGKFLDAVSLPALSYNVSYGRTGSGQGHFAPMTPTPGESNVQAEVLGLRQVKEPVFSAESGFYETNFEVTLAAEPGLEIYYTLDGSDPTPASLRYTAPIAVTDASDRENVYANEKVYVTYKALQEKIDKATVLRAVAYDPLTRGVSETVSATYFVDFAAKKIYDGLPVLSVVTDPANLFDFDRGIYTMGRAYEEYKKLGGFEGLPDEEIPSEFTDANGVTHYRYESTNAGGIGREWEREVQAVLFDEAHRIVFEETLGMRIAGESTRYVPQKSFNLFARDIYGSEDGLRIEGLAEYPLTKIRLRRLADEVGFREPFLHALLEDRAPATQASIPCVVFMDGEYWGMYNLKENYDETFFENRFGVAEEDLLVFKNNHAEIGTEEEVLSAYKPLQEQILYTDLSREDMYEKVRSLCDVGNLADYFCAQIFLNHTDIEENHNQMLWRSKAQGEGAYADARWRYLFYDLDFSCEDPSRDTVADFREKGEGMYLPDYLLCNEAFRAVYEQAVQDYLTDTFAYERVHPLLMEWKERYQDQVIATRRRFGEEDYSAEDYDATVRALDDFFKERPATFREIMQ